MRALKTRGAWGLVLGLAACGDSAGPCGPESAVVAEVVDGDTVVLEGGARVRYLLADAPESTGGRRDCFGAEAQAFNRALVEGRRVSLSYGEACTDRFGRLLAYVAVEGHEVNALLLQRGLACALYVAPAGGARRAEFEALEAEARRARRGLWGACMPVSCDR
jgi:micrococcal nuclease